MSGHNKWNQIKHKKAITDKKRGQSFSKLSKLISLAARKGINPITNLELKNAIDKAREVSMPNDNIQRAINKVADKSIHLEELYVEALGPGNVALRIKAITDNRNRTIAEIKKILGDNHSKMVTPGSISWMLSQTISIDNPDTNKELDTLF